MPDNSNRHCNMCVTGLDESLTSADLHLIYSVYGAIKSCKVVHDPTTLKSKCYGFVWFEEEDGCKQAMLDAKNFLKGEKGAYQCSLFEMGGLRHARACVESDGF